MHLNAGLQEALVEHVRGEVCDGGVHPVLRVEQLGLNT